MSTDVSKCAQVVFELMCKVAECIVSSKVELGGKGTVNSKFSLHVQELEFVRNSMKAWENNLTMPLCIDIFWEEHRRGDAAPRLELLEKWEIVYEAQDATESKSAQLRHFFKRSIVFLRTLYSFVRLLPAYRVHKRIQTADPSVLDSREETGFCLYPGGSCGSGLDFSAFTSDEGGGQELERQSARRVSAATNSYGFKPLDAPNGSVTVICHYRRGVDSQASQYGHNSTSSSSLAPNMMTSLIQDYVPRDERHAKAAAGVEMNRTKLASTPEDGVSGIGCYDSGRRQHARVPGSGAFSEGSSPDQHPAAAAAAAAAAADADMVHWPSPEQGHGYAERRVYKQLVGQGGPAPFLTPGPHRGRMLGVNNVMMEPLDLGPNAGSHVRVPLPDVAAQNDDVCEMGDRFSPEGLSSGDGRADPQGSSEAMIQTMGGRGAAGTGGRGLRPYRRNSISESSSTAPVPREQPLLSIHGAPHSTSTGSTPPFSYNISEAGSLGQTPLVSFSPPFDTAHVGPQGRGDAHSTSMRIRNARTPVPVHLDTLPESPFSLEGSGSFQPPATRASPTTFSRPLPLPQSLGSSSQEPTPETTVGGAEKAERLPLPFSTEHPSVEGVLESSSPPSTLFALCSAAPSKSTSLMQNNQGHGANPDTAYTGAGLHLPPGSLEEDLEQFRMFQHELEKR